MTNVATGLAKSLGHRRGADLMLDILEGEGVRYIFGNPGTTELPLIDAMAARASPSYVLGLQEVAVVAMADGYAQASGRVGVVNLHTSGGLGHAMGALLSAQASRTPLVVTAGQQDARHIAIDPLLSGPLVEIARPAVKWAREVSRPDQLPTVLHRAFRDSRAAPSGPTFLSLPIDVLERSTEARAGRPSTVEHRSAAGSLDQLSTALLRYSPGDLALVVGDEVFTSEASCEAVDLAEALGAPVFGASWPGHIPFPTAHPHWRGNLPPQARDIRARLSQFKAVLILGGRSLITYLYTEGPLLPEGCDLYQISHDATAIETTDGAVLGWVGDLRASLKALLPRLNAVTRERRAAVDAERALLASDRAKQDRERDARLLIERSKPGLSASVAAAEVVRAIGPDVTIVDEAPVTMAHVRSCLHSTSPRQYVFARGAILGWGMPAALGTSLGLDRAPVVALLGDGSAMYSPQTLWTAAHERLPVTFVIMNNREYGILKAYMRGQDRYVSPGIDRYVGMDLVDPVIDFVALAASMGVPARRVARPADIAGAVEDGIASGAPNLIEISIIAS